LVVDVERHTDGFTVSFGSGERYETRKVVLATGVVDVLPDIDGFEERWGRGVYHCPYCHGYEVRDQPLGVYVDMAPKLEYAKLVSNLSDDLVVFTDGNDVFDSDTETAFVERGIRIEREGIVAVDGVNGTLDRITLADGRAVARDALFYGPLMKQRSVLVDRLDLDTDEFGFVDVARSEPPMGGAGRTSVEGVFVAGDASNGSSPSVVTAAAEGYEVGATVNAELSDELF